MAIWENYLKFMDTLKKTPNGKNKALVYLIEKPWLDTYLQKLEKEEKPEMPEINNFSFM